MPVWIAFLRGVNVGGHHKLPMKDLREAMIGPGCDGAWTYIQSGNLVFSSSDETPEDARERVTRAISSAGSFEVPVVLMTGPELVALVKSCPFDVPEDQEKTAHAFFYLEAGPAPEALAAAQAETASSEQIVGLPRALLLHAPDGIGRSKLVSRLDRLLGVATTGRNWKTLRAVLALCDAN